MGQSSSPPITAADMVTLHALHGICPPCHSQAKVRQCMPISAHYFHEHTRTRWEEVTLIYFNRRAARRQRGARLDRERQTLQIVTTLVTVSIPFMSQRGGSLSLSLSHFPCTSCISSAKRVMSPIRFPHGSA